MPCLPQRKSLPRQYDKYNDILGMSLGSERLGHPHCISEVLSHSDAIVADSNEMISIISASVFQTPSISSKQDAEELVQSHVESSFAKADTLEHSSSQVNKKSENDLIDNRLGSSLCSAQFNSDISSGSAQKIDSILRETSPYVSSEPISSGTAEILLDSKESHDKCYSAALPDQVSVSKSSAESSQSPCVNPMPSVINSRGMIHKPPVSPAINSNCPRTFVGRRNSNGFRLQSYDRSSSGITILDSSIDSKRPERPNHLSLPTAESNDSKCPVAVSCASSSYISSSASSCSLSDEDFRTASEASQHSTPVAECVIDGGSHSWAKSEVVNLRGDAPGSCLLPNTGADVGTVLPPSPPLNRTPISRVKERARSRVVKRSKTPPEEDLKSAKIDSLTKRVKELMAALASKEAELIKSKESASLIKKRSTEEFEPKSKMSLLTPDEKPNENVSVLKQNLEDEINSPTLCTKGLADTTRLNEYEDNSNHLATRRFSSSSTVVIHSLPRMGSLSDLTNVDLDLDLNAMDQEWYGLRARFEKAVREIHALRKELRACQGHVDALELEGSAMSMCLAEERKRAEADMQLMASRVQDLTVKLSASEKQVRQLKQKTLRVETREKRRSLSLRSERDGRSGTDPSLCSGKLPKEICDRLTQLEDTLAAALGRPLDKLKASSPGSWKNDSNHVNNDIDRKASLDELSEAAKSSEDAVNDTESIISSNRSLNSSMELGKGRLEEQLGNIMLITGVHISRSKSTGNGTKEEKSVGNERNGTGKSGVGLAKALEGCSASEQKRIEGRRQRVNSRIMRRSAWQDASRSNSSLGLGDEEQIEEEARAEDDSSKKCDPLRILVRLSSLEGRVADFLKTAKNGKKMENTSLDEYHTNEEMKISESEKVPENPCPRCEDMRLAMDRMKEELMLVNNDGSVMLDRYREEIEQLRALCEKGMRAMDLSHQRLIKEMEEKHREEVNRVLMEKEQALREETKATLAALDAMRKAHETEVQREVAKFKEEFSRRMSAKQELSTNHQAEMEGIRREILSLSQRYSSKCVECASLRERLRIARGMKDRDSLNESGAYREVLSEHS
ncbi:hypothetical protein J437_LFUL007136 [Ladona fulva]|uniref:Uncharacterized protein n=1 Tax=Ladona fulva TaxID=123851 RepID=A0A8K0K7K3_LADFU|nr:hypothetical protein J437_LFUL007136 [Ladona fulva]